MKNENSKPKIRYYRRAILEHVPDYEEQGWKSIIDERGPKSIDHWCGGTLQTTLVYIDEVPPKTSKGQISK